MRRFVVGYGVILSLLGTVQVAHAGSQACTNKADPTCYVSFHPPGAHGVLHFFTSLPARGNENDIEPTHALIVIHGHPRDADKTFDAALLARRLAARVSDTLVIAPVFQVPTADAQNCHAAGVPLAQAGDLLWTCESWLAGGVASNDAAINSFSVLDALVAELKRQWPSLKTVTVAGFSAGAQMVQHYIGFAADQPGVDLRYVVADPGTWLYFDPYRAQPERDGHAVDWSECPSSDVGTCRFTMVEPPADCVKANQWKYGIEDMPVYLKRDAAQVRQHYAQAEIRYIEGALDGSPAKGTYYPILDKSCAAVAQGPYRLQRGLAYAAYDRTMLAPERKRAVTIVPACAHDVACVFPSEAAREALLGGK